MTTVSRITQNDYDALISLVSDGLPRHGIEASDLTLTTDELDIVIRHNGGGQFVADALGERRGKLESDTFDAIAIRATARDINQAFIGCGLAVMAALQDLATRRVLQDVTALRDRERPDQYDRRQEDAELGTTA